MLLVVNDVHDSRLYQGVPLPMKNGFVFFEWTPSIVPGNPLKPRLIYSHFISSLEVKFQSYYDGSYDRPAFWLNVGWGSVDCRSGFVPEIARGKKVAVFAFWRLLHGGQTEAAIMVNGRFVAHGLFKLDRGSAWPQWCRIGARDLHPTEPSMGAPQHVDGVLENFVFGSF